MADYDGTIAPLGVTRAESRILGDVEVQLKRISRQIPVCIVTAKDYEFIHTRASFADGWACVGGLDVRVGGRSFLEKNLRDMTPALEKVESIARQGVIAELKRGPRGEVIGLAVDWSGSSRKGPEVVRRLTPLKRMGFHVVHDPSATYADVYSAPPSKGKATKLLKSLLNVRGNVMFIGDSKQDNTAFRASGLSVGVAHGQPVGVLRCEYIVDQSRLAGFLRSLADRGMDFSPSIPWVRRKEG